MNPRILNRKSSVYLEQMKDYCKALRPNSANFKILQARCKLNRYGKLINCNNKQQNHINYNNEKQTNNTKKQNNYQNSKAKQIFESLTKIYIKSKELEIQINKKQQWIHKRRGDIKIMQNIRQDNNLSTKNKNKQHSNTQLSHSPLLIINQKLIDSHVQDNINKNFRLKTKFQIKRSVSNLNLLISSDKSKLKLKCPKIQQKNRVYSMKIQKYNEDSTSIKSQYDSSTFYKSIAGKSIDPWETNQKSSSMFQIAENQIQYV